MPWQLNTGQENEVSCKYMPNTPQAPPPKAKCHVPCSAISLTKSLNLSPSKYQILHPLLDLNPLRFLMNTLRYRDMQDTVLQARLDTIRINSSREAEATVELPYTAFTNPVLVLGLLLMMLMLLHIFSLSLRNLLTLSFFSLRTFILHTGLVVPIVMFLTLLCDTACAVDDVLIALVVLALDTTFDD